MNTIGLILSQVSNILVSFVCTSATLTDPFGATVTFTSPAAITLDISASGLNGLDIGTLTPSTWYNVWAVSDGTNLGAVFSTSLTSPTMPAGYTYKSFLGTCRTNSLSAIIRFRQVDNVYSQVPQTAISNVSYYPGGTSVPLPNFIPPNAVRLRGTIYTNPSTAKDCGFYLLGGIEIVTGSGRGCANPISTNGMSYAASFDMDQKGQNISIGTSNSNFYVDITGWNIQL